MAPTRPGQLALSDQLVSTTPGFIPQIKGILITNMYKYATAFVDKYYHFTHMHFQKTDTEYETIEGKIYF